VVASVVLGPGSILTGSKVGCQFGYDMLWLIIASALLMAAMTALSATAGVSAAGSLLDELTARVGRPLALVVGVSIFLVAASFQFGNNLAVAAALDPLEVTTGKPLLKGLKIVLLVGLNVLIAAAVLWLRDFYKIIERGMMLLVGVMLAAFAVNLLVAAPSLLGIAGGLLPSLPEEMTGNLWPRQVGGEIVDSGAALTGLFATTFSVAGAFYQGYLVREKGWTRENVAQGLVDSFAGIAVLGLLSAMIMTTSAAVLHGVVRPENLQSLADVAGQLRPTFGPAATVLFGCGIFAAAFSSFLVNAMVGGTLLSDGIGWGASLQRRWPRVFTIAVLATGCVIAVGVTLGEAKPVPLIIFAQAVTVLANPLLACAILYLAWQLRSQQRRGSLTAVFLLGGAGTLATIVLAARTAWRIWLQLS